MKIKIGKKWGAAIAAALGAASVAITDGILDSPDIVTILLALVSAVAAGYAGKQAWQANPEQGDDSEEA